MNPSILKKYSGNPYVSRFTRVVLIKNYEKDCGVQDRIFLCKRALDIIQTYPITGSGVGTFYRISPFYGERDPRSQWLGRRNAHNYYAQFCADLGVPAFLLFLGIIVSAYRKGFRGLSLYEESGLKNLLKSLMFGLSAYLITMIAGHPLVLSSQQFLFWFAIAVISINYQLANSAEERASG
jgi:O-antigen ligase